MNLVVVEGVTEQALRAGAGHYPDTSFPGEAGNVAIAGHRRVFGRPFQDLERLAEGDEAFLESPEGRFAYRVIGPFDGHANPWVTSPDDWPVLSATRIPSLTLTTDTETGARRLIVRLVLAGRPVAGRPAIRYE